MKRGTVRTVIDLIFSTAVMNKVTIVTPVREVPNSLTILIGALTKDDDLTLDTTSV